MTPFWKQPTLLLVAGAVIGIAAVGAALVSQHVFGMEPCPWCILQRLIFLAIALACLIGLAVRQFGAALVMLLSLCGIAAALWQHFKAAASSSWFRFCWRQMCLPTRSAYCSVQMQYPTCSGRWRM